MSVKRLFENTYCLTDKGPAGSVRAFLLIGEERALLIDTGYGATDFPTVIKEITKKPVTVALTHGHLDHAGGAFLFDDVYMHTSDKAVFEKHTGKVFLADSYKGRHDLRGKYAVPLERIINSEKRMPKPLEEIETFDLGGRVITWINISGHTPGCCTFLDEKNGVAFTGDMLSPCIWLQLPESRSLDEYKASILKLKSRLQSAGIRYIYPAHYHKWNAEKSIDAFCRLVEAVKSGKARKRKYNNSMEGGALSGTLYGKGFVWLVIKD